MQEAFIHEKETCRVNFHFAVLLFLSITAPCTRLFNFKHPESLILIYLSVCLRDKKKKINVKVT